MDIDFAQLASQTATLLAPYLPYLIKGGKEAAQKAFEKAGKKLVEGAWDKAESLYEKFKPKIESKEAAQEAVEDVIKTPDDKNAQASLEHQIKKILEKDAEFAKEVFSITTGDQSLVVGRDMTNSTATLGDGNLVATHGGQIITNNYFGSEPQAQKPASNIPEAELVSAYLRSVADKCSELSLGIVDPRFLKTTGEATITLAGIYIDLDVQPPHEDGHAKAESPDQLIERERETRLPVLEALNNPKLRRLVILGDPGSGKTTCLNYIGYGLARQNNPDAENLFPEDWSLKKHFPVLLVLREVAARHIPANAKKGTVDMIWNAVRADLITRLGVEFGEALFPIFKGQIMRHPCLIMLDGLDEVTEADQRRERLIEALESFTSLLAPESCVLVTARPYAYTDPKWHLHQFKTLTLLPFSNEQIERFIERWYQATRETMKWDEATANEKAQSLNSAIGEQRYLFDLAERPLLLTLMATLHTSWGKLPEDRADLYDESVKLLLDRWQRWREARDEEGNIVTEKSIVVALAMQEADIRKALHQLAHHVHTRQGAETNRQNGPADILQQEVLNAFMPFIPDTVNPRVIVNYLETRAGLLLGRGNGIYAFPHRSFQEYLAACYLNDLPDPAEEYRTRVKQDPTWWREVFLLGIGKMKRGGLGITVSVLQTLVEDLHSGNERSEKDWQALALTGKAITELKLDENNTRFIKLISPVRHSLLDIIEGGRLTPRERAEAGDTLAKLGDPRPGVIPPLLSGEGLGVRDAFLFCEIPAGKFLMGNTKETDALAFDDEMPQFEYELPHNYFMSRYPITNAQFELFVKDPNGYTNNAWWTEAGLAWRADRNEHQRYSGAFALPNHPVVGVTWYESVAFTRWLTYKLHSENSPLKLWNKDKVNEVSVDLSKWEVRLPTEAEWEKAARGEKGERYPWGDEITANHANYSDTNIGTTSAVGCFPAGQSPYGLLDMSGNVWEWCATQSTDNYAEYLKKENNKLEGDVARVLRGGAFNYDERLVRCAFRSGGDPDFRYDDVGFRVVVCVVSPISP